MSVFVIDSCTRNKNRKDRGSTWIWLWRIRCSWSSSFCSCIRGISRGWSFCWRQRFWTCWIIGYLRFSSAWYERDDWGRSCTWWSCQNGYWWLTCHRKRDWTLSWTRRWYVFCSRPERRSLLWFKTRWSWWDDYGHRLICRRISWAQIRVTCRLLSVFGHGPWRAMGLTMHLLYLVLMWELL